MREADICSIKWRERFYRSARKNNCDYRMFFLILTGKMRWAEGKAILAKELVIPRLFFFLRNLRKKGGTKNE